MHFEKIQALFDKVEAAECLTTGMTPKLMSAYAVDDAACIINCDHDLDDMSSEFAHAWLSSIKNMLANAPKYQISDETTAFWVFNNVYN